MSDSGKRWCLIEMDSSVSDRLSMSRRSFSVSSPRKCESPYGPALVFGGNDESRGTALHRKMGFAPSLAFLMKYTDGN